MENIIKKLYSENISIRKISKEVNRSQTFIEDVLKKSGLYINSSGEKYNNISRFTEETGYVFKAICKSTKKEFSDYKNVSGELTTHLKNIFSELIFPSNYIKREQFKKTGIYWHEQFFDIIKIKKEDKIVKKCAYCNWETIDINNKTGWYTTHLKKEHNISIDEYILSFPEEKKLFPTYLNKVEHKKIILSSDNNNIECKICGEKFLKITNSHLKNAHGISLEEYRMNYSTTTLSNKSLEICRDEYNKKLKFYEPKFTSNAHNEIISILTGLNISFDINNKKELSGVELDIFIPNKKIAIEYNGLYYHSETSGKKDRMFHLSKTKACEKNGIQLIHIFEDDWIYNKKLIISKLKHVIGESNNPLIHTRKCYVLEITKQQKDKFLDENHIQGADSSNISIGAFFEDKLIAVMTFDNNRNMVVKDSDVSEYELKRFSTDINFKIPGVADKLLKFFIKKYSPKKIISFADRCWSTELKNNLYINLGFKLESVLNPDYKYFNPKISRNKRLHKFSFGKTSLKKKFPEIYSDNKTEWEIMKEAGYDRIWDCGKYKYSLINDSDIKTSDNSQL